MNTIAQQAFVHAYERGANIIMVGPPATGKSYALEQAIQSHIIPHPRRVQSVKDALAMQAPNVTFTFILQDAQTFADVLRLPGRFVVETNHMATVKELQERHALPILSADNSYDLTPLKPGLCCILLF